VTEGDREKYVYKDWEREREEEGDIQMDGRTDKKNAAENECEWKKMSILLAAK